MDIIDLLALRRLLIGHGDVKVDGRERSTCEPENPD